MEGTHKMSSWNSLVFQKSFAITFPVAFYFLKADGAYIRTCNNDGTFLSISDNGTWNCPPCTICPDGFRVSQPCRHNTDAVCERCPRETFVTETGDKCRPCTVCQPGQYIEKHCHGNQDRKCKTCAQGYYSSRWNSFSCRRCKHCRQRESVIRRCNGKNNSICGDCEKEYYRESSTLECIPCSECQGEDYVTVRECIRKLGEHSQFICQLRAYVYREKESQTQTVTVTKAIDQGASQIYILSIILPALLVVVAGLVLLLFFIAAVYWRCSCIVAVRRKRNSRADSHMIPPYNDFELSSKIYTRYINTKPETTVLISHSLSENTTDQQLSEWPRTDCGTTSDEDMLDCSSGSVSDVSGQTSDTLSLLSCQENLPPRVHRKKKRRRQRHDCWQSDSNIVTENRYAVLDAAKFTTI